MFKLLGDAVVNHAASPLSASAGKHSDRSGVSLSKASRDRQSSRAHHARVVAHSDDVTLHHDFRSAKRRMWIVIAGGDAISSGVFKSDHTEFVQESRPSSDLCSKLIMQAGKNPSPSSILCRSRDAKSRLQRSHARQCPSPAGTDKQSQFSSSALSALCRQRRNPIGSVQELSN